MYSSAPNPPEVEAVARRAQAQATRLATAHGARPAGSAAEQNAQAECAGFLEGLGWQVERLPVKFAPPGFYPWVSLCGLALAAGAALLPVLPWVNLGLPLLGLLLPDLARGYTGWRRRSAQSDNLLARQPGFRADKAALLLVAHLDTAPASGLPHPALIWLNQRNLNLYQRLGMLLAALGAVLALGLTFPAALVSLASAVGLSAGLLIVGLDLWAQLGGSGQHAPGANDNASGVGLALALAEQVSAGKAPNRQVAVLLTSAEETGLHGAQAFASQGVLNPAQTRVLNLDMLGAGDTLRYIEKDGGMRPLRSDSQMNQWITQAVPQARPLWHLMHSSDLAAFLRHGYRATALQVTGSAAADLAYHTRQDLPEQLTAQAFILAAGGALGVIRVFTTESNHSS